MAYELKRLRTIVDEYSLAKVAVDLGYRTPSTIFKWFKQKKIPMVALVKTRLYLNLMERKNDKLLKRRA